MDSKRIILAAHRGDRKCFPENTMPAFMSAIAFGCDMIETDIHMTADGELILFHDRSAKRTTGVDRPVDQMTLAELQALDAGALFDEKFRGTRIPTVAEFMDLIREKDMLVNWEFKDYPHQVGDAHAFTAVDKLIAMIEENGLGERSMLNSFSDRVLAYAVSTYGHRYPIHGQGINRCPRSCDTAEIAREDLYDWCCLYPNEAGKGLNCLASPENFTYCRENGIKPCVCFGDTEENYRTAIDLGCRMFTSNDIYAADCLLRKLGER